MKLIHLSDLHLGKKLNEFSLYEDQKYILRQITDIIHQINPDGVILAGDIYDKAIPSVEAVQLLDNFLTELANLSLPVFIISGNHDSAERLGFGARIMAQNKVYFAAVYDGNIQKITLQDKYGPLNIYLLPFIKPAIVKRIFEEEVINSYNDALETVLKNTALDCSQRNILVAHQFVTGAFRSDSEEILVGGLDNVDAALFADFDYVALGHIHGAQNIGSEKIRYCGTPLKYSFSEYKQQKSVTVIDLKDKGQLNIETVPLIPLRDMVKIKGTYLELTELNFYQNLNRSDYFHITLTDKNDVLDAMQKLRVIYPNLMQLEYDNLRTQKNADLAVSEHVLLKSEMELFEEFYKMQNNADLTAEQKDCIQRIIDNLKNT